MSYLNFSWNDNIPGFNPSVDIPLEIEIQQVTGGDENTDTASFKIFYKYNVPIVGMPGGTLADLWNISISFDGINIIDGEDPGSGNASIVDPNNQHWNVSGNMVQRLVDLSVSSPYYINTATSWFHLATIHFQPTSPTLASEFPAVSVSFAAAGRITGGSNANQGQEPSYPNTHAFTAVAICNTVDPYAGPNGDGNWFEVPRSLALSETGRNINENFTTPGGNTGYEVTTFTLEADYSIKEVSFWVTRDGNPYEYNDQGDTYATNYYQTGQSFKDWDISLPDMEFVLNGAYVLKAMRFDGEGNSVGSPVNLTGFTISSGDTTHNQSPNQPPSITVLGDNPAVVGRGQTYTDPDPAFSVTDPDGDSDITDSGVASTTVDTANSGEYTITYFATDGKHNGYVTATRTVAVIPPPTLTVPAELNFNDNYSVGEYIIGSLWNLPGVSYTGDTTYGALSLSISAALPDGALTAGAYDITYTVTDAAGQSVSETGTFTVAASDTTAPVITVTHHASSWFHIAGNNWSEPGVSAYDNEEGANVAVTTTNAPTTNTGATQSMSVGYSASDSSGNTSSATRVISVLDFPTIDTDWDGLLTITSASAGVGGTPTQYDIVLQDSNGNVVASSASPLGVGVGSLDVSSLAPGTYQIIVQLSLLSSHPQHQAVSWTGYQTKPDMTVQLTNLTIDDTTLPADGSATFVFGADISGFSFDVTDDDTHNSVWTAGVGVTNPSSPHTVTTTGTIPAGSYTWTLTGSSTSGQQNSTTGTFVVAEQAVFQSVAVTADVRPWDMANVRWGIPAGASVPSDMLVQIERKTGTGGQWTVVTSNQPVDGGGLNGSSGSGYFDQGLTPSTTYYYRLIFVDSNGTQGSYSTELEYATIAIPTLAAADVNTRGVRHPIVAITGTGVTSWYWTTETVTNPQDRTKAEWDADPNANHVDNLSGGVTSEVMSHLGPGTGNPAGNHLPGAYNVTVCGFWGGGDPITSNMNDPSVTANTVHVIPYNVYSGVIGSAASPSNWGSDWSFQFDVTKPNDAYDWHRVRYLKTPTNPNFGAGDATSGWGTEAPLGSNGESQLAVTFSISDPDQAQIYISPVTDENDEQASINTYEVNVLIPKGCAGVTATVSGDNLAGSDNASFDITPAGLIFSPTNIIRVGDTAPPANGDLSNWGTEITATVTNGNLSAVVSRHVKTPGTHTFYAQAVFPDGTAIGSVVSTQYTIAQAPYTGLTDLKFTQTGASVSLEAYGYFPQWRYYVGVLPAKTEQGADMSTDPNGTAVTEDIQTPTTAPSSVEITIEPDKKCVVIGLATDGQYLIGKPLIRILNYSTRNADQEYSLRTALAPESWDPTLIVAAGVWGNELDDNGNRNKEVLTTSVANLAVSLDGWAANGLTEADLGNLFIGPKGSIREVSQLSNYLTKPQAVTYAVTGQDANGKDIYGATTQNTLWSAADGTAHMGIDFSAEITADFANVDNALVTLITDGTNGIVGFDTLVTATADVNLTADPNGTLAWPLGFVKERVGQVRNEGLISKEDYDQLLYGKRTKRVAVDGSAVHKRADVSDYYPNATLEDGQWTKKGAKEAGETKVSNKSLYGDGFAPVKLRSGEATVVSAEDFAKKTPVFRSAPTARLRTTSSRGASSARLMDLVLDKINDRSGSGQFPPDSQVSSPVTDQTALLTEIAGTTFDSNYALGGKVEIDPADRRPKYDVTFAFDDELSDPKKELFVSWSTRTDEEVPLEILKRYLLFGNAPTVVTLQELYDLEKTGDNSLGTGRNRAAWKAEIVAYATLIDVTINE